MCGLFSVLFSLLALSLTMNWLKLLLPLLFLGISDFNLVCGVDKTKVDLSPLFKKKKVAYEAYGKLHELLGHNFSTSARIMDLSRHLLEGTDLEDPAPSQAMAKEFVEEMKRIKSHCEKFVVVFDGRPYVGKKETSASRRATMQRALDEMKQGKMKNMSSAIKIPDCIVKQIMAMLTLIPLMSGGHTKQVYRPSWREFLAQNTTTQLVALGLLEGGVVESP